MMASIVDSLDLEITKRATTVITFDLYTDENVKWAAASDDQVRFKIWDTDDAAPALDVSETMSDNGSQITITTNGTYNTTAAVATLFLAQDDTATLTGGKRYKCELGLVDNSATQPADAYSVIASGICRVKGSATGDRDLES
jgi:hypothetical protein